MVFFTCGRNYWSFSMSFFCSTRNFRMRFFAGCRYSWCFSMSFFCGRNYWSFSVFFGSTRSFCMSFFSFRWNYWCNRCYRSFCITTSSGTLSRSSFFFSWSYSMCSVICTRVIRGCIFFFIFRFISYNIVFCFDLV